METGEEEHFTGGPPTERNSAETVHRLQRRLDGLYAERKHFAGRLDEVGDNLNRLEARSRSWLASKLSRNLEEQVEFARLEYDEARYRFDDVRQRFEAVREELDQARARHDGLLAGAAEYEIALTDKEDALLAAGDPRADRLRAIAADLERQAVVLQETDDLLTSVGWSDRALDTLDHLIGRARTAALTDIAGGGVLSGKAKYDELAAVGNAAAYAERCLAKLRDELQLYGARQPVDDGLKVDAQARFLDIWLDSPGGDLRTLMQVMQTQNRIPRTRSLLQQVGDDLRLRRAEILTATDRLTAERRRLLTD
jgi:PHD/YefM family antitoxin component YafN of YafNO toxin-antitoxin module